MNRILINFFDSFLWKDQLKLHNKKENKIKNLMKQKFDTDEPLQLRSKMKSEIKSNLQETPLIWPFFMACLVAFLGLKRKVGVKIPATFLAAALIYLRAELEFWWELFGASLLDSCFLTLD